jgi:rhamnosyltransferase subunit B
MSARIVITTFGSFGDVNPYLGLARALAELGHQPVIATSEWYRRTVEHAGILFRPVRPDVDPTDPHVVARIMDARSGGDYLLRKLLLPCIRDSLADLRHAALDADLIVTHPLTFAGPLVAEERNLPWVSTVLSPMSFFSAHDVPVFSAAPFLHKLGRQSPRAGRIVLGLVRSLARLYTAPVRTLREELGLPAAGDPLFEGQHSPRLVLGMFSKLLVGPQPDWPTNTRITGPIFYDGSESGDTMSPELRQFLAQGAPPVVFTLGSSAVSAAGRFYEESFEAARRLGCRAVLLTGSNPGNRPVGRASDDILVCDRAPYSALFPRAAAIVHHGGIGTTAQSLRAGRPMIVVPFAHDQPDNADRVARLGVSRTISPSDYKAKRVVQELEFLLGSAETLEAARGAGDFVNRERGLEAASEAIDCCARRCEAERPRVARSRASGAWRRM